MGHNAHLNIQQWLTRILGVSVAKAANQTSDLEKIIWLLEDNSRNISVFFFKIFAVIQHMVNYTNFRFP